MAKPIMEHEGGKYLRKIVDARDPSLSVYVDVYAVLDAFGVTCPARAQAVKKLLCCGNRGKGDELDDLLGAEAAVARAIDLERVRRGETTFPPPDELEQLRNERVHLQRLLTWWIKNSEGEGITGISKTKLCELTRKALGIPDPFRGEDDEED